MATREELTSKYKKSQTKTLQKLRAVKTGEELEVINEILASRGALEEHPNPAGAIVNPTETPEFREESGTTPEEAELIDKAAENAETEKDPEAKKEKKEPKSLKKQLSDEEAKAAFDEALKNKGRFIEFLCTKTKTVETGIIKGVRLDKRNNFSQYRIQLVTGELKGQEFGKGIDSTDIKIGELAPVEKKEPKVKKEPETKAPEADKDVAAPDQNDPLM